MNDRYQENLDPAQIDLLTRAVTRQPDAAGVRQIIELAAFCGAAAAGMNGAADNLIDWKMGKPPTELVMDSRSRAARVVGRKKMAKDRETLRAKFPNLPAPARHV